MIKHLKKQRSTVNKNMQTENFIINKIKDQGILPLFYNDDAATSLNITRALYDAGMRCIEYTNRGMHAFDNFSQIVKLRDESLPGLLLGIGTIKSADDANRFINAGADFLVSPVFDSSICDVAYINKVPWIPGCMTPTEIHTAQQAGCTLIKLFPGNLLQPSYVEAVLPLFPRLDLIVTGGVDATGQSIKAWFKSGVAAIGIGGKLITKEILEQGNFELLKNKAVEIMGIIQSVRSR
jgi:2-dehydro-3-deoxyphosphogluconate aldolase / (4S)-4-hydroxy-2-oxoglutarate aldolase